MEVVFQRVLREGRGRRGLGRVSQQGRRAPASRALGELVRVCQVLGSCGSQCVWSSHWEGAKGGMIVADRALGLLAAFLLPGVLGPDVRTDAGLDCVSASPVLPLPHGDWAAGLWAQGRQLPSCVLGPCGRSTVQSKRSSCAVGWERSPDGGEVSTADCPCRIPGGPLSLFQAGGLWWFGC